MRKKILYVIPQLGIVFLLTSFAFALSVTPARQEIKGLKGMVGAGTFVVSTNTKESQHIVVKWRDWFKLEENKEIEIKDWLKIDSMEFELIPGEKKKINYKVKIPDNAVGMLMAMVSFCPRVEGAGVGIVVSSPIYVIIEDTEIIKADIYKVMLSRMRKSSDMQATVVVENKGNVYLRPRGKAIISKGEREIATIELKHGWPVFPRQKHSYIGHGKGIELKKGKYKMRAIINYGSSEDILEKTISFKVDKKGNIKQKK